MIKDTYRQVKLSKKLSTGTVVVKIVAVPMRFARLGETLKIKRIDGEWDNDWIVDEVFQFVNIVDVRYGLKHHRENSDLPRGEMAPIEEDW